jgi:hypothetical protein
VELQALVGLVPIIASWVLVQPSQSVSFTQPGAGVGVGVGEGLAVGAGEGVGVGVGLGEGLGVGVLVEPAGTWPPKSLVQYQP